MTKMSERILLLWAKQNDRVGNGVLEEQSQECLHFSHAC